MIATLAAAAAVSAPVGATRAAEAPATAPAPTADQPAQAAAPAPAAQPSAPVIDPDSIAALKRMGAYLRTLTKFEIRTDTTIDLVTAGGQNVQVGGNGLYKVQRPDKLRIEIKTTRKSRTFVYDGKKFSIYTPALDYYATVDAPPTIRATLDEVRDKFGISLPLDDLFRWSDPNGGSDNLDSGIVVGPATIDGVDADQYAFREGDIDWQVWIQRGDRPLPLKLVITDRSDSARPTYSARLTWNLAPTFSATDFVFQPDKDAKAIRLSSAGQ
jgi:hypothetical protein